MTKKTHEMQAERKENKWATSSVSPGFGFIVLSSVFGFCFFPSSRVKYHHQIGGILFFNSTIGFDSVNFWRVLSQCCVALISGGLAPVHSSSSIRHFLSFLSRRVCVCVSLVHRWLMILKFNSSVGPEMAPNRNWVSTFFYICYFCFQFPNRFPMETWGVHGGRVSISLLAANVLNCG